MLAQGNQRRNYVHDSVGWFMSLKFPRKLCRSGSWFWQTDAHRHFLVFSSSAGEPNPNAEEDPLPNEDHSPSENNSHDGQSHNDLVRINVTNEMGLTKPHISNGWVLVDDLMTSKLTLPIPQRQNWYWGPRHHRHAPPHARPSQSKPTARLKLELSSHNFSLFSSPPSKTNTWSGASKLSCSSHGSCSRCFWCRRTRKFCTTDS